MTTPAKSQSEPKPGYLARFGTDRKRWEKAFVAPAKEITPADAYFFGAGPTTVATLLGTGDRLARNRQIIYEKWMKMESNPIIASAIAVLVTAALGGHETTGDVVFVEESPIVHEKPELKKVVDNIRELSPMFNRIAFQIAYTGAIYGDAYARIYSQPKVGVLTLDSSELVRPQLVQPYERTGRTVGFSITVGERNFERLDITQMARLKMPRTQWIPQFGVVEKSLKIELEEDDIEKTPVMPSMVGGSLLYNAEEPYDNLMASLVGLVGQRWIDSIDEQYLTINLADMPIGKQEAVLDSVKRMLLRSKEIAQETLKSGRPYFDRIRHIIPISNEKQMASFTPATNGRNATLTIDDVMLHARLLAGALGVDLSMIGFADQMSGGLGEGGFFRVSAQAAERARIIRVALADFFNSVIDIHTYQRWGVVFSPTERPWNINFFGSISALEAERQRTRNDAANAAVVLAQAMQLMKEMGADKQIMQEFLEHQMMLDEDQAKLFAKIVDAKPEGEMGDFGGEGGGGFGPSRPLDGSGSEEDEPPADDGGDVQG